MTDGKRHALNAAYDPEVDALSVDLYAGARRARTVIMGRGMLAHFDRRMRLIEVEVLGASAHLSRDLLERLAFPRPR